MANMVNKTIPNSPAMGSKPLAMVNSPITVNSSHSNRRIPNSLTTGRLQGMGKPLGMVSLSRAMRHKHRGILLSSRGIHSQAIHHPEAMVFPSHHRGVVRLASSSA